MQRDWAKGCRFWVITKVEAVIGWALRYGIDTSTPCMRVKAKTVGGSFAAMHLLRCVDILYDTIYRLNPQPASIVLCQLTFLTLARCSPELPAQL